MKTLEKTVAGFLKGWKDKDVDRVLKNLQETWAVNHSLIDFKDIMDNIDVVGWHIISSRKIGDAACSVKIYLKYNIFGKKYRKKFNIMAIRETGAYEPSETGSWGVNPISFLQCFQGANK